MMKKTVLGISVLSTLVMVSDVYAQATYFGAGRGSIFSTE